jgi:glycosyltransferase involved in cell wall biosynthesis
VPEVAVVIPAYNEADRVGATVAAARALPGVGVVVVVDDGSRDATAAVAREAGARTLRYARNHGKSMAMMVGAREVGELDRRAGRGICSSSMPTSESPRPARARSSGRSPRARRT